MKSAKERQLEISERIATLRKKLYPSQRALAVELAISESAVHHWESARSLPPALQLEPLALKLKTTVGFILTGRAGRK